MPPGGGIPDARGGAAQTEGGGAPARPWESLLGGVLMAGVGIFLNLAIDSTRQCGGASAQLRGVWDELRRDEVKTAILATGASFAPDAWAQVEARLDEYARGWATKHTEVCEATAIDGVQSEEAMDLRMDCLRERKQVLQSRATYRSWTSRTYPSPGPTCTRCCGG